NPRIASPAGERNTEPERRKTESLAEPALRSVSDVGLGVTYRRDTPTIHPGKRDQQTPRGLRDTARDRSFSAEHSPRRVDAACADGLRRGHGFADARLPFGGCRRPAAAACAPQGVGTGCDTGL